MVLLHVKLADKSLFLFETTISQNVDELVRTLVYIYNGTLKIERLCYEISEMSKHGVCLPPNMQGLTKDQIHDLKLKDEWAVSHDVASECIICPDPIGKRNGLAPLEKYSEILLKTTTEAKTRTSQKLIQSNKCLTSTDIDETLDILRGAVMICYPMELPPYDTVKLELDNKEDLSGTQASKEVMSETETDLWWANKQLERTKTLGDYIGKNEKSKIVVKLQKRGRGPPSREPVLSDEQRKDLMMAEFRRREEFKRLEEDDDDSHLDSQWADNLQLKKSFLGLSNIKFK